MATGTGETGTGRGTIRAVAVPTEHGGWSLTAEPVLLGLLVAWSLPGLALGVAAMLAFVARTPLKVVLVDRWRHRWLARSALALRVVVVELVVLAGLVAYAVAAGEPFWLPIVLALPLIGLELWFDMRSRSRRLVPELAGSIGIGAVATAIALTAGASDRVAWGLWAVVVARSLAAIPYVRHQIKRGRANPEPRWLSDGAQVVALAAITLAWAVDLVPGASVVVIGLAALVNLVAVRLPAQRAVLIGIQQTIVGLAVIVVTALASA